MFETCDCKMFIIALTDTLCGWRKTRILSISLFWFFLGENNGASIRLDSVDLIYYISRRRAEEGFKREKPLSKLQTEFSLTEHYICHRLVWKDLT